VLADRVGLAAEVREALAYSFERWDGSGLPVGAQGDAIPVEMRVVQLADVAEVHLRLAGVDGAVEMARSRSGTQFDPAIAATFDRCAREILEELPGDVWRAALAQAPDRDRLLTEGELDGLLEEKPGPLSAGEWERVRLHPYLTGRILSRCTAWSRWRRWRPPTTSGRTGRATRGPLVAGRSRRRRGCSRPQTPTTPWWSHDPSGAR
jgi:HD domain